MNCEQARFTLAAEPHSRDPALEAHVRGCPACAAYAGEMRELDRKLLAALRVPVPRDATAAGVVPEAGSDAAVVERGASVTPLAAARPRARVFPRLALAASVAAAFVLAGVLWSAFPRESLADAVVGHMVHEPDAWRTSATLSPDGVARAFAGTGMRLRPGTVDVTYASLCAFRGHDVPHLVVKSAGGPVTVMVLAHERVASRQAFDEGGYRGVLVPAPHGAIAVLARRGDAVDVDAVAARATAAVDYSG